MSGKAREGLSGTLLVAVYVSKVVVRGRSGLVGSKICLCIGEEMKVKVRWSFLRLR